jgi:flagellar biosynthesis/type III secretory pathway protein FliH
MSVATQGKGVTARPEPGADVLRRPTWLTADVGGTRSFAESLKNPRPPLPDAKTLAERRGYEEGLAKAKASVDGVIDHYQHGIRQLELLRDQICRETEEQLVELALLIAKEIIKSDVESRREFTCQMVDQALGMLREAQSITLRLAPADVAAVRKRFPELVRGDGVTRIIEDRSCDLGGVVAEADLGRVDASVERRLAEVARELRGDRRSAPSDEVEELAALLQKGEEK